MPLLEGRLVVPHRPGPDSVANHAACLRGVRSRFFMRAFVERISIRFQRNKFRVTKSRADALRMGFQEVARTAGRVIRVAYDATRTGLRRPRLFRLLPAANPRGRAGARITAVVASAASENGEERRRGHTCRMSDVSFLLRLLEPYSRGPSCGNWVETLGRTSGEITARIQKNDKTRILAKLKTRKIGDLGKPSFRPVRLW